ncbi:nucleotidyltransferase family protein [Microbacterium hydrothermale]|uniref:nucleotidyltransferase family protein n=1 Tax=Microbacterium hydrothermale TaxID=857427 RepID=UPI001F0FE6F8|nr:nucleotidyltransferase family protein [Microbacterium hydrothermale]
MASAGLATTEPNHPAVVSTVPVPALSSPIHELLYAVVHHVARERGVACVFVKGPALHRQGLRTREHSGDIDVWCHPSDVDVLARALEEWGWHRAPDPWAGTSVPHSTAMLPSGWGCEIDIHRRIPGLTLDDDRAFHLVREDTVPLRYAGVEARVPSPATHAVIAAVNAVRPGPGDGARATAASASALSALQAGGRAALERARELGAVPALQTQLRALTGHDDWRDEGVPRDWKWRTQPTRWQAYAVALLSLPRRERYRAAIGVLWPSDEVALASARKADDPTEDPGRARRRRLIRGLREALPGRFAARKGARS